MRITEHTLPVQIQILYYFYHKTYNPKIKGFNLCNVSPVNDKFS